MSGDDLADRLAAAATGLGSLGVDGPDTAGKTTLADRLAERMDGAVRLSVDDFLTPPSARYARGELSPVGCYRDSHDLVALRAAVRAHEGLVIVDGVFLHRPELRDLWDLSVYLHVTDDEVLRRAAGRDALRMGSPEEVERRYRARYLPAQELYRREVDPLAAASVVVDNTDPEAPAVLRWT